ncbi:MAG: hypothetical protein J6V09_03255 [Clostridia bacterium]|nr:hypothetical protein [Clostridia bacterium]
MSTPQTLEDFVKSYLKNKAVSESPAGYAEWLKANGVPADKIYADSIKEISTDYRRQRSEFGSNAEALASLGLTSSGYSDYVNGKAYSDMQKSKYAARKSYDDAARQNVADYTGYVKSINKEAADSFRTAVKEISDRGILNFNVAYNYALASGLSDDAAKAAASAANELAKSAVKESVTRSILTQRLTEREALGYAIALGLSEEEATELSKYAEFMNHYLDEGKYSDGYLDYLKDKINSSNKNK